MNSNLLNEGALLAEYLQRQLGTEKESLLMWTLTHRTYLQKGRLLDFAQHLHLIEPYSILGTGPRAVVIYKASQTGASELALSYALHACDRREATVLYVFSTDSSVSDFSSARVGPALDSSPYLEEIVVSGAATGQRGADRVGLKRVRDRFLYFRGSRVRQDGKAPQLRSVDADVVILDELDEMDLRALPLARKRLGHSLISEELTLSTPTFPHHGIHKEWDNSDQREWHIRCEGCGRLQVLSLKHLVTEWDDAERPSRWNVDREGIPILACEKCHKPLNRTGPGIWVPRYPGRDTVGYHLTKLFSSRYDLMTLIRGLQSLDEMTRQETWNQDLAEPYTPEGGRLSEPALIAASREYRHGIHWLDEEKGIKEPTVAGIDVGKVLHLVIRSKNPDSSGERKQRWAGETTWDQLPRLLRRYNVKGAVIDGAPEAAKARDFQGTMPRGTTYLAYFVDSGTKRMEPVTFNRNEGTALVDRTRLFSEVFAGIEGELLTIPVHVMTGLPEYFSHMQNAIRVQRTRGETKRKQTVFVSTGPDHLLLAEIYCEVAARIVVPRLTTGRVDFYG